MSNNIVLGYFKGGVKDDAFSNTHRESEIGECKIELGRGAPYLMVISTR